MKICYLADAEAIHAQRLMKYFADREHEVHLISRRPLGDNNKLGNIRLHVLNKFRPQIRIISFLINLISNIIQVKGLIKRIRPDLIHAHYVTEQGFLGALSGFHPFILGAWGSDVLIEPERNLLLKVFARYTLKEADLITCDGENLMVKMVRLGADSKKIKIIYFGVDTQRFSPRQRDNRLREELMIFDSPTIISTRNLAPIYDIETLIKAIPLVLGKVPDAKFIIAGKGLEGDYEGHLKRLAKSLGFSNSIRFVGWIAHDELPSYLASSDIYVSTSLSEGGIAVGLTEAMSCGLAPVVTDVGDVRQWIKDGENGFVIPTRRPDLLAEKITFLLENKDLRAKMGKPNRQLIEERANYQKEMDKMHEIYEHLNRSIT